MDILKQQQYLMKQIHNYNNKIKILMGLLDIVSQIIEQQGILDDDTTDDTTTDEKMSLSDGDIRLLSDDE